MADNAVISFEHLRETREQERDADGLTSISDTFFQQAQNYLEQKQGSREGSNAATIIQDIVDLRAKKMVDLAALHTQLAEDEDAYTPDNLTETEETFYATVSEQLAEAKENLLDHALDPVRDDADTQPSQTKTGTEEERDEETETGEADSVVFSGEVSNHNSETTHEETEDTGENKKEEEEHVTVEIQEEVPVFLGIDLKRYGPYSPGETPSIPRKNADVLTAQNKAQLQDT